MKLFHRQARQDILKESDIVVNVVSSCVQIMYTVYVARVILERAHMTREKNKNERPESLNLFIFMLKCPELEYFILSPGFVYL